MSERIEQIARQIDRVETLHIAIREAVGACNAAPDGASREDFEVLHRAAVAFDAASRDLTAMIGALKSFR